MSLDSIMDLLSAPQAAGARSQLGQQLGLSDQQAGAAIQALLPALAAGLASNAQKPGGLEALLGALSSGKHDRYLDKPEELGQPASIMDGNAILGHLLGSKDMSRAVAGAASKKTGLDDKLMKMALPMVAAMVMGQLSKKAKSAPDSGGRGNSGFGLDDLMGMVGGAATGGRGAPPAKQGGLLGGLMGMLDADKDGSVVDDIFAMVMKSRK
jgi:hypothetical protein